ncbi:MAG: glycoside hydrolase domain-containing protein [Phormidesmis sp.]
MRMLRSKAKRSLAVMLGGAIALFLLIVYHPSASTPQETSGPFTWAVSSLERINRTAAPRAASAPIALFAARGEYEAFQIAIRAPETGLTNVTLSVSDLQDAANNILAKTNIALYREHYVQVKNTSPSSIGDANSSLGGGWYADALIPFADSSYPVDLAQAQFSAVPFNLDPSINQPIWVEIFVPRTTPAGRYQGTYTVSSDQGTVTDSFQLTVWNFELPLVPSLNSTFTFWNRKDSKPAMEELLKHRLMPDTPALEPADQPELIRKWGLRSLRLPFWSGANIDNCAMEPAPSIAELKAEAALHNPSLSLYVYSADEIDECTNLYEPMRQWANNIHQAGLKNLVVMTPTPELYDAVDIWVVLPEQYESARAEIEAAKQRGDEIWFYTALLQDSYSPKWLIDFTPLNYRLPHGLISQSLDLEGALYWAADYWIGEPWQRFQAYEGEDGNFPGEGMLLYPGEPAGVDGVIPSIRLKWVRDGVEDYEYIEQLKRLGRGDWALGLSRSVAADWRNWTRDPKALASVRKQLGEELERLSAL